MFEICRAGIWLAAVEAIGDNVGVIAAATAGTAALAGALLEFVERRAGNTARSSEDQPRNKHLSVDEQLAEAEIAVDRATSEYLRSLPPDPRGGVFNATEPDSVVGFRSRITYEVMAVDTFAKSLVEGGRSNETGSMGRALQL